MTRIVSRRKMKIDENGKGKNAKMMEGIMRNAE
jgi:hypothetical protein